MELLLDCEATSGILTKLVNNNMNMNKGAITLLNF